MADEAGYMSIRREAVIDTDIAHAYGVVMQLSRTVESFASQIRDLIPRANRLRDHTWMLIDGKREIASIERIRALFEAGEIGPQDDYGRNFYVQLFGDYDDATDQVDNAYEVYKTKSLRYEGWSRFFLVPGGHIHSSMYCSTCNKANQPTEFQWLPELSGLTEDDAVKDYGAILCTVCYPNAPVEFTNQYEIEKASKDQKRCPSSGTSVGWNGTRIRVRCPGCGGQVRTTPNGRIRAHDKNPR